MPRVHTKKKSRAGKQYTCGRCGRAIEPGELYYSWTFRYGGKHFRCSEHRPRSSELTQSKMATVYSAQEDFEEQVENLHDPEQIESLVTNVGEVAQEVADEYREAAEPFGGEGENAERADALEGWAEELASWSWSSDDIETTRDEAREAVSECPL